MDKLLDQYREKFGEQFPLMLVMGMSEDDIIKIIEECLEKGVPYDPELEEGADY